MRSTDDLAGLIAETLYDHRSSSSFSTPHYVDDEYDCCARAITAVVIEHYRTKLGTEISRLVFEIEDPERMLDD